MFCFRYFLIDVCLYSSIFLLIGVEPVLIFYNGGQFKVIIGWAVPVDVPVNVVYAQNIQFQYFTIDNATKFSVVFNEERKLNKPITRNRLIRAIQPYISRDCVMYLICEAALFPIVNSGIFGEILQTILTPTENSELELIEAYNKGFEGSGNDFNKCVRHYPSCHFIRDAIDPFLKHMKVYD